MNPSGFYVDPCFPPEKEHGGASRAGPGKRRSQPHVDVNSHVDAKKKPPELLQVRRLQSKTAATYSPTVTQYHRRDKA